jgi:hypothetical protein
MPRREYYRANLERSRANEATYREKNRGVLTTKQQARAMVHRKRIERLKASVPCMDCGRKFPHYVMEFDHVYQTKPRQKPIATMTGLSWLTIQEAMMLCHIVCANCHRIRTWRRNQQPRGART